LDINSEQIRTISKDAIHLVILIGLVVALLFAFSMFTRCSAVPIPGWCDIYWGVLKMDNGGNPKVLIVYGDGGLGDHELLEDIFESPAHLGKSVTTKHIDGISLGNLTKYDLVIVEEARRMGTDKIKMFIDYANTAGKKLVWTGDAGSEAYNEDEYVYWDEYPGSDTNNHAVISPWIRKQGDDIISLEKLIGVRYLANYCDVKDCEDDEAPWIGTFSGSDRDHRLIKGIREDLQMYGNFAITDISDEGITTRILDVDFGSDLITKENVILGSAVIKDNQSHKEEAMGTKSSVNLGSLFPVIVSAGFGENVVYYSIPPELFASDLMPLDDQGIIRKYYSLAEKMYYGMLY